MALKLIQKLTAKILGREESPKAAAKKTTARPAQRRKAQPEATAATSKPRKGSGGRRRTAAAAQQESPAPPAAPRRRSRRRPAQGTKRPPQAKSREASVSVTNAARTQGAARRRPGGAITQDQQRQQLADHAAWSPADYQVAPQEGKKRFLDFELPGELLHAVADLEFEYCTPIQALSLAHALAGKSVTGRAQTGTGKTAAFLVAILARYLRSPEQRQESGGMPRALVIAPTRELVIQIAKDSLALGKYCNLRSLAIYGGMDYEVQKREVQSAPVDLLIATPGRLLDFVRSRVVDLSQVDTLVIDEADRMLDMGFIPDVRAIINRLPAKEKRCTMLYSATLDDSVKRLANQWMSEPVQVEVESETVTTKNVKQIVYVVTSREKFTVLHNLIQQNPESRMLVFCNRRTTTEGVAERLRRFKINCEVLSGDVNQNRRLRVLEDFRAGKVRIVVATDVAGRGLHVDDIGFVVNYDFPYEPEDYVHRIGRTGRAGHSGTAVSFADEDESFIIPDIEEYIGEELRCTVLQANDELLQKIAAPAAKARTAQPEAQAKTKARPPRQRGSNAPASRRSAPRASGQAQPDKGQSENAAPAAEPARMLKATKAPALLRAAAQQPSQRTRPRFSEEWVPGEAN